MSGSAKIKKGKIGALGKGRGSHETVILIISLVTFYKGCWFGFRMLRSKKTGSCLVMISSGLMWDEPNSIEMSELAFLAFWNLVFTCLL